MILCLNLRGRKAWLCHGCWDVIPFKVIIERESNKFTFGGSGSSLREVSLSLAFSLLFLFVMVEYGWVFGSEQIPVLAATSRGSG
jgi:hypothetical protein